MIFKPEMVEKILAGEKTVTRRRVKHRVDADWNHGRPVSRRSAKACRYRVGQTYALQSGRGKKGVGRIRVVSVTRGSLGGGLDWSVAEAEREGFACWSDFVEYWCRLHCGRYDANQLVDRIEFELVAATPTQHEETP